MSIKDDTFEMLDNTPEKSKKSLLLLVLLVLIISVAIPLYVQKHNTPKVTSVADSNEPVQTAAPTSAQTSAVENSPIKAVVIFDQASAVINPDQMAKLQTYFQSIKDKAGTLQLDGYTDNLGLEEEGFTLSQRRSEAVAAYLKSLGLGSKITINLASYGEKNPVGDNSTEQGRQQNRRVELMFTPAP